MKYGLPDVHDGAPWSDTDIEDLKGAVAYGRTLEQAAEFLCRSGSLHDVAEKAKELSLKWRPAVGGRGPAE